MKGGVGDEGQQEVSEFQDKHMTCADCGGTFLWSADDQAFFAGRGFTDPSKRCKPCRQARNDRLESERKGGKK